jgi:peptidoglycan/LPS O-acetylase OafA/YrhL/glycosyltransferase involved in cell wall biosynthesis
VIKIVYIISDINKALAFEWIAAGVDQKRFQLHFVLLNPGDSDLEAHLKERNIPVQRIKCGSKKDWVFAWFRLLLVLLKLKPQVVHCHLFTANILGLSAAKVAGVPARIYTRHHSDFHFRYFPSGVKWDKWCNRMATHVVAPSKVVVDVLAEMEHLPQSKISLIHHGFDLDYFAHPDVAALDSVRQLYNPDRKGPVIGVIARFTKLKGIQFIIPAFERLLQHYPDALLLLFNAKGDFEPALREQLSALPAESYRCVPFESRLSAVYPLFDVFVQASTDRAIEAFGQTYVEAAVAGVPMVCTLAGVASEFLEHGRNALVVDYENSEQLYEQLLLMVADKQMASRLAAKAKEDASALFTSEKMINSLEELYTSATNAKDKGVYLPALTGVRAIAAGMVCLFHANPFTEARFGKSIHQFFNEFHVGVTFFFVLSGFLIALRYQDKKIEFGKYFRNRVARIYPVYFLLTTLYFLPQFWHFGTEAAVWRSYLLNITFLRGFFEEYYFSGLLQGWSLTVEETFYLFAPLVFFLLRKNKGFLLIGPVLLLLTGYVLVQLFQHTHFYGFFGSRNFMLSYTFFGRATEFFVGIGLAMLFRKHLTKNREQSAGSRFPIRTIAGILSCVLSIQMIAWSIGDAPGIAHGIETPIGVVLNNMVLPFGIALFYWGLITEGSKLKTLLSSRFMILLGKSSYAFYLIHLTVIQWNDNFLFAWTVSTILAIGLFYMVEEPMHQKLKAKS